MTTSHDARVTATHTINAYYAINNSIDSHELEINGTTLDEIIAEMIDFANGMEEKATTFEVTSDTRTEDEFKVTIEGEVYRTDQDGDFTDDTDTMTIIIEGWEK